MNIFESIVLGLIQGLTEFLPVSSSGHLQIAKALLGKKQGDVVEVTVPAGVLKFEILEINI